MPSEERLGRFLTANGGCGSKYSSPLAPYHLQQVQSDVRAGRFDTTLFGKPILEWSDADVASALHIYHDCQAQSLPDLAALFHAWQQWVPETVALARNLDAQRKAQQQATIEHRGPASAEEPQARPGVIRDPFGDKCFQRTDTYGNFRDQGPEIPCDGRYKEGEKIAYDEFVWKTNFKMHNSPEYKAYWEAWQASAASGATTYEARNKAFDAERQKERVRQAKLHADESRPFLHGACQPNDEKEKNDKEALKRNCEFEETLFQEKYSFALQGDHDDQQEVARCFQNDAPQATNLFFRWPCHRVVYPDETKMCAWYLVAASSGHPESAKAAEQYGYVNECDKKPLYQRQVILGTASDLFLRIYHRPLPVAR